MHVVLRRVLFCVLIFCAPAFAQVATGTYPYGSFDNKGFDTINRGNLNTHFSIPVINKPGRGLPFYYNLGYDSSIWYPVTVTGVKTWTSVPNFGWRGDTEIANGYVSYTTGGSQVVISQGPGKPPLVCRNVIISNFTYHDPFGVQHPFAGVSVQGAPAACGDFSMPSTNGFTSLATDGSGYTMKVVGLLGASIITASGQTFAPPLTSNRASGTVTDSNGNRISTDNQGHFTDTLGKQVLTVAGGSPNPETFTYTDTNGNPQAVQISYTSYTLQTNFGCSGIGEANVPNTYLVNSVTLPDGSAYHFQYEQTPGYPGSVTGRLASVALPTGGTISYSYSGGNNGIVCADGSTAGLTRSISSDSGSASSTWTYTRTIPTASTSQTDVGNGNGNHSVYDFILAGTSAYYETNHVVYQGAAGGNALASVETCYNSVAPDCTTSVPTLPISQIDTYVKWNNGPQRGSTTKYNQYGLETEKDAWDYGTPSARGTTLLRKEIWSYPTSGIVNLVSSDEVYDGAGNLASATYYGYDQTTPTPSSAIPQHIAITGPRGNLTTVNQWLKTGSSIITMNNYEDTGALLSSTDSNGTTTYSYDPTASYVTNKTLPTPSSGVTLSSSATYDMNAGVPLTVTDLNGGVTTAKSYDSELRPTEVDYPDGGKEIASYSFTQTAVAQAMNSSASTNVQTLYDGYGRKSRVAVGNGQATNPYYQTDYCYDAAGRLQFQSTVYQGTGWGTPKQCSGSGTTYTYDALNRPTAISNADGMNSYLYTDRAVSVTDVNGVQKITQSDALGRTAAICEISSNASMPGSGAPQACGMDIAGTGFLTNYSYDLANHKTTITQGAQTRIFQTDAAGRTIYTKEPERGETLYSYAYNSTGLVLTRKRPRANQSSASSLTTTTTQYDSLGRPVSVSYDDGITPNKTYDYDAVNSQMQWSASPTNLKGRLADMASGSGTTLTRGLFNYDLMGRITWMKQCAPSICGTTSQESRPALQFGYDLAGNLTMESDGASGTIVYSRSIAGEVTSITNQSYQSTGNPPNLVSNIENGPYGPVTYDLGNGVSSLRTYDSSGRLSGGWLCPTSNKSNCYNAQIYGFYVVHAGVQVQTTCDTVINKCLNYGYDEFNRLTSGSVSSGTVQNFNYVYDRYGNRWQQDAPQGGPAPSYSFNASNNQAVGLGYDAVGNLTNDGFHSYIYDAEGNILQVDNGSTAQYVYDGLNRRVRVQTSSSTYEYLFDYAGHRISSWLEPANFGNEGRIYWDGAQIAYRAWNGTTYFDHQDWLGTERMRTDYTGAISSTYVSLPWGDGYMPNENDPYGNAVDNLHFAQLDHDSDSSTDHAQFRQYSSTQGRWMGPDPYDGSYNTTDPQSFNRYVYGRNNPLSVIDPSGLSGVCVNVFPYGTAESYQYAVDPWINNSYDCSQDYGTWVETGSDETVDVSSDPVGAPGGGAIATPPSSSDSSGTGGGAVVGGGSSAPAPSSPLSTIQRIYNSGCVGSALKGNAASLSLDVLGVALAASPLGPETKIVGAITLGITSTVIGGIDANSATAKGRLATLGAVANTFGIQTAPLELAQEFARFSKGAGKVLTGVGVGADLATVGVDIKTCLSKQQ